MDGEDVRHLDVESRLCPRIEVVEFINVKRAFSGWNINHYTTSVRFDHIQGFHTYCEPMYLQAVR